MQAAYIPALLRIMIRMAGRVTAYWVADTARSGPDAPWTDLGEGLDGPQSSPWLASRRRPTYCKTIRPFRRRDHRGHRGE